ncbi:MAG: phosphonate ABC transporter ATP-binding protein [Desulfovibrionales bacterium]|nr:MAG: phosphonate ABC transporter ATP-binding protein [Desulfovibrionales bacterium]
MRPMIRFENIQKRFGNELVLKGVNLTINEGEFVAVIGASGGGKTTLIRTVNGFVVPSAGNVYVNEQRVDYANLGNLRQLRKNVGMIYQLFNLVERTSAMHNVLTGTLGSKDKALDIILSAIGYFSKSDRKKAMEILDFVGLKDKAGARVDMISGGQKQRVAIARALMQDPTVLLADEPIANLDPKTSQRILDLLHKVNQERNITVVTVIHHFHMVKDYFSRVIAMKDGQVAFDGDPLLLEKQEALESIYGGQFEEELAVAA